MSRPQRNLRDALTSIVPNWLANRPGLNTGFKVLWAMALMCDVLIEVALQGLRAAWPGKGTSTALPLVGQSRGLIQGPNEPDASFAAWCRAWLTTWFNAGSAELLAQNIQRYLTPSSGPLPVVRVVDRQGQWVTANADGSTTFQVDTAWNWDSVSNPERASWWGDIWIVIVPSPYAVYANLAAWSGVWGVPNSTGLGHAVPQSDVDNILSTVSTWKGLHNYVQAIIWTTNTVLFVPGSLSASGNPDGTWGTWSKVVNGVQVPARNASPSVGQGGGSVRFWEPAKGGLG